MEVRGPVGMILTLACFILMLILLPVSTSGIRSACSNFGGSGASPPSPVTTRVPCMLGWNEQ